MIGDSGSKGGSGSGTGTSTTTATTPATQNWRQIVRSLPGTSIKGCVVVTTEYDASQPYFDDTKLYLYHTVCKWENLESGGRKDLEGYWLITSQEKPIKITGVSLVHTPNAQNHRLIFKCDLTPKLEILGS